MNNEWFYYLNEEKYGPFCEEEMKSFLHQGKIEYHTLIWKDGMKAWLPVHRIPTFDDVINIPKELEKTRNGKKSGKKNILALVLIIILIIVLLIVLKIS